MNKQTIQGLSGKPITLLTPTKAELADSAAWSKGAPSSVFFGEADPDDLVDQMTTKSDELDKGTH